MSGGNHAMGMDSPAPKPDLESASARVMQYAKDMREIAVERAVASGKLVAWVEWDQLPVTQQWEWYLKAERMVAIGELEL